MKFAPALAALLLATTAACATADTHAPASAAPAAGADTSAEDRRLNAFLDAAFDAQTAMSPQALTSLGSKQDYDRLNDYTDAHRLRQVQLLESQYVALMRDFDVERLGPDARLSYEMFAQSIARARQNYQWRWHGFPISTNGSPAGSIPAFLINQHRIDSVADAEAYVSRIRETERVMNEISANVRHQAANGIVPPAFVFAPVRADARAVMQGAPFGEGPDMSVYADFKAKVGRLDIADAEKRRLEQAASAALTGEFRRGVDVMLAALDAIEPQATSNDGAWRLPDGDAFYANRLSNFTTTELTADEIHQIGLREVARIHGEMERIKTQVGFAGTLPQFFQHINDGAEFKYPNTAEGREQYLADARAFSDQVMGVAPQWFRRLPQAPLEVRAVEEWRQDTAAVAFYNRPSPDGSRPGIYYVNLADMNQVLAPQTEAISYHEGAPGHHFQIALAQELPDIPRFRRFGGQTVYTEGWGLYAELLGKEMGFYREPMSEFGMYSTSLWRAVRLVVDTGLHSKRWSRERAIDYFRQNALLSERDAIKEVERYINNPGQATAYMIGQLEIVRLRQKAEQALGDRFDIRDFHAAVLESGAVPLDILERLVDDYIAANRS